MLGHSGDVSGKVLGPLERLSFDVSERPDILLGAPALHLQSRNYALECDDVDVVLEVEGLRGRGRGGWDLVWMSAMGEARRDVATVAAASVVEV